MDKTYMVSVRGVSHKNHDGSSRQDIIRKLRMGDAVNMVVKPMNKHDRLRVAVFSEKEVQIGFLPSDARDSATVLRGEPMTAEIYRITGGTNWFSRSVLGKKYLGVVLKISKPEPDWDRYSEFREIAKHFDERSLAAVSLEKKGNLEEAISEYQTLIDDIARFTLADPFTSAHRQQSAPVNRLTLCLEKKKQYKEALNVIKTYEDTFDPIQPNKAEISAIQKRKDRLLKKLS